MRPSPACIALVKRFEGFRPGPYLCPAGVPTIGYGHTQGVTLSSPPIREEQASGMLVRDLGSFAHLVEGLVHVPVTQSQFDALVSFAYNLGAAALAKSTLLQRLNAGDTAGAAQEFARWVHRGQQVLTGLVARRAAERAMFEGGSDA